MYKRQEIKVGSQNSYNITLEEDSETLDEVVVIGYGTARKIDPVSYTHLDVYKRQVAQTVKP